MKINTKQLIEKGILNREKKMFILKYTYELKKNIEENKATKVIY
jgi:hypothetical protein